MSKHKTLGQVFTPKWIVNEILDLVDYQDSKILDKSIFEPSSGDGAFLLEIVNRYIKVCIENKLQNIEIKERLEKYIYAVELDEIEFRKSLDNLNSLVEKFGIYEKINWNIFNGNTLNFYKNYLGFFDYIVGNPPYIRVHNLDLATRKILKNEFQFSEGTIDIYLSFFEMGFKMLKNDGYLGYITPNSYLHNSSYQSFRDYLKREKTLKTLIDFKANKIFDGYSTYTAITIFNKNNQDISFEYKELVNNKIVLKNKINFNNLNKKDWSFTDEENKNFLLELEKDRNASIKDFFDVQYGFATLRDKIYIGKITPYNDTLVYFNSFLIEKDLLKKVIKGSRFKGQIDENEKILFPYELINNRYIPITENKLEKQFPKTYQYLLDNKNELESRDIDKGALWYEFGRSQGIQTIHNEKIVLSTLINGQIDFYKVPKDVLMYSGLFIVKNKPFSDWKIIEETLSSEEFYKYIRLTGKDFSNGYKSVTSKQIKEFKIKANNPESLF
jgi:adenine-specific DNA-methyltransferase